MWREFIRSQRGSVSAVVISLVLVTLILLMAVLDREWINYTLKLAEQTADFAAESGARAHEAYTTMLVDRYHYEWVALDEVCTKDPLTGVTKCVDPSYWSSHPDTFRFDRVRERDLVATWKQQADCGDPYWSGGRREYACTGVRVLAREVQFPEAAEQIARDTFRVNWTDRSSAVLRDLEVRLVADSTSANFDEKRSVFVMASLDVGSLFGLMRWRKQPMVIGRAVVTLSPLAIRP